MSKTIIVLLLILSIILGAIFLVHSIRKPITVVAPMEIHCKHFFYGYPLGTPPTNDLIIRDIYALSSNDRTKLADWVAYRLDPKTIIGDVRTSRDWKADPWLDPSETLEPEDYKGANAALGVDRGHLAPLASFKGTDEWQETNYLSNITPQKSRLNQGLWRILEEKVRAFVGRGHVVYVMTGPIFGNENLTLPSADEEHRIPSGYWKIVLTQVGSGFNGIRVASFMFDQNSNDGKIADHLTNIDEIERRTGLDFLWEIPDDEEEKIEGNRYERWVVEEFL